MNTNTSSSPAVISLAAWLKQIGITSVTAWRWRRKGWLTTINICGRQYLTAEAVREFAERAARGEFSQKHTVPTKGAS